MMTHLRRELVGGANEVQRRRERERIQSDSEVERMDGRMGGGSSPFRTQALGVLS